MLAAAAAQCFALGIFDCRITNETPTFGIIVRPDTSSWAAAAAVGRAVKFFVNLLLSGGGRDGVRQGGQAGAGGAGMLNMTHPGGAALPSFVGATAFL